MNKLSDIVASMFNKTYGRTEIIANNGFVNLKNHYIGLKQTKLEKTIAFHINDLQAISVDLVMDQWARHALDSDVDINGNPIVIEPEQDKARLVLYLSSLPQPISLLDDKEDSLEKMKVILNIKKRYISYCRVLRCLKWFFLVGALFLMSLLSLGVKYSPGNEISMGLESNDSYRSYVVKDYKGKVHEPVENNESSNRDALKALLQKGVGNGDYAVALNNDYNPKREVLYVFSDPLCPHCRSIEPVLEKLTDDFLVYVFPVSVIGGEKSTPISSSVLCKNKNERNVHWRSLLSDPLAEIFTCEKGRKALAENNTAFRGFKLEVTPALIRGDGEVFDASVEMTPENITKWLDEE